MPAARLLPLFAAAATVLAAAPLGFVIGQSATAGVAKVE